MSNFDYFNYSLTREDTLIDFSRPEGTLVISKNASFPPTSLMDASNKLNELIITYKTLTENGNYTDDVITGIVDEIITLLLSKKAININYTPFCNYFQVLGYSYSTFEGTKNKTTLQEKRDIIKMILSCYIENRLDLYQFHGYSHISLQVNSDLSSSRRKSKTGIEKIEEVILPLGFVRARSKNQLESFSLCYITPDKGDNALFREFLQEKGIAFEFSRTRDNKTPDLLIKIKEHYFIIEHKLTNGGGGAQNAEINEIIQFISYRESNENVHYVSCLQGDYFSKLSGQNLEPKVRTQYLNIQNNLTVNPQNYFVNGLGIVKLIRDYMNV